TFVALQLAYWMGFQKIIILGLDHQYSLERHEEELAPHQTAQRQFSDTNHFHTEYFGAGMKWQLPDLAESERAYAEAERAFSADGRKIVNATPGSQLNIFERLDSPDHKS
ncbi:MAG: hypothetical protein P8P99_13270, partial [Maricaulis sp.]|nr:hypothetical protein [Maricaulis sp.]